MSSAVDTQIKNRISEFVNELDHLVRQSTLEALQGILANGSAPARRGRPAKAGRKPGRPKGSGRRGSANVEEAATKIVSFVRSNDGQGISTIASGAGVALPVAKKAASQLLSEGQLKKSGQKRGTVYHVGSGRPAMKTKAKKAGKRRGRKAKKAKAA